MLAGLIFYRDLVISSLMYELLCSLGCFLSHGFRDMKSYLCPMCYCARWFDSLVSLRRCSKYRDIECH